MADFSPRHSVASFELPLMCTAVHEALDPEYSILKQRLARRLRYEGAEENGVQDMSLVVRPPPPGLSSYPCKPTQFDATFMSHLVFQCPTCSACANTTEVCSMPWPGIAQFMHVMPGSLRICLVCCCRI